MAEPDRIAKAKDKFFAGMPEPTTGQAARRLIKVAEENSGYVYWGARGLSIRSYRSNFADWQNRVTVAWIFLPGWQWMRCKDFSFGAGPGEKGYFEGVPAYLREFLEKWAQSFAGLPYVDDASSKGAIAYSITHAAAVQHIDELAERLKSVLVALQGLEPA